MRQSVAAMGGFIVFAGVTNAAIIGADQSPSDVGVDALFIGDGSWDFYGGSIADGQGDYGVWEGAMWMREVWIGGVGAAVGFDTTVTPAVRSATVPIAINKNVTNTSTFDFAAYEITLIAQGGTSLSNVGASVNSEYSNVTVTEVVAGLEYLIEYSAVGGDTGTIIGNDSTFSFSFDIDGGVDFEIIQVAIPTPGAAALVAIGGLAAVRRRR